MIFDPQTLSTLTIDETHAALKGGAITAAQLATAHYDNIRASDGQINSFLSLSEERALKQAERIDALATAGDPLPPLAGIPIGIKDVLTMTGSPATAGSKILKDYHPPYDCTAVARLEAAGAILLGKLNCDEFAMGRRTRTPPMARFAILVHWTGFLVAPLAALRRLWRLASALAPLEPIRGALSASLRLSAVWLVCCQRTDVYPGTD